MAQLIDKSALVAEIEKKINEEIEESCETNLGYYTYGCVDSMRNILSFIDTLEVKDVDLNLEITLWANTIPEIRLNDVERLAKYFFELGMTANNKVQKGE